VSKHGLYIMIQTNWKDKTDTELVIAAILGNLKAFDELVLRFRRSVETVAGQYLKCIHDVEEVVQDAFILAFKALPELEEPSKFGSWLYSIRSFGNQFLR